MNQIVRILVSVFVLCELKTAMSASFDLAPAATDEVIYKCDFDSDICGMTIEGSPGTNFTWVRFAGATPSNVTGPDFDHTTNSASGYYMYTEATDHDTGEVTKLIIPQASINQASGLGPDACLTFWYHMYGYHIGTLNVTVSNRDAIWSRSYNQSSGWKQANVTLSHFLDTTPSTTGRGDVTFVGERGGKDRSEPFGDIAIDDVIIYAGRCGFDETTTAEPTTTTTTTMTTTMTTTTETTTVTTTTLTTSTTTKPPTPTPTTTLTTTTTIVPPSTANTPTTISFLSSSERQPTQSTTVQPESTTTKQQKSTTTELPTTTATVSARMSTETMEIVTTGANRTSSNSDMTAPSSGTETVGWSTPRSESQSGNTKDGGLGTLSERDMIILITILSVAVLLLLITVIVLLCCLLVVRRKYNVERSANLYPSSSSIDGVSTVENNPQGSRGSQGHGYVSPYDKTPVHHF